MFDESNSRRSPLSMAMPAPLGRGLYVEPPLSAMDRWLPRLQIAIGVFAVVLIIGGLILGFTQ